MSKASCFAPATLQGSRFEPWSCEQNQVSEEDLHGESEAHMAQLRQQAVLLEELARATQVLLVNAP